MTMQPTLLLNQSQIAGLVNTSQINQIVKETFVGLNQGSIINPSKVSLDLGETGNWPDHEGFMNAMPAYLGYQDLAGLKWVGGFLGDRKAAGLPYITGLITLLDPKLGHFLAVMDGAWITNHRTGAQVAVSLASVWDPSQPLVLGLYGAGMQARQMIIAVADLLTIDHVYVWNHREETAQKFKADMASYVAGDIIVCPVADQAGPCQAPVILTMTSAQEPLIKTDWIKPGHIVFPMGSFQEIENQLILKADQIIVDHIDQALNRGSLKSLHEKGEIGPEDVTMTIGDLVANKLSLANWQNEISLCIPIGTGAMDVAIAAYVYQAACQEKIGEVFDFTS
ncbi:hypothetical protein AWM75_00910 [Aerococcus urinaehominis]|uniref:Uncharacterized protein n=1 Tax=Aerococcus urinaehominis TaxID=128944 RepID=A0A0X8FJW0_9LACT|nr:ornithine cyclodeaminase family protein [Aerococcus urinaehominis]AMB98640.1 hypothetical protein AWM75_00910 [Aerococcus urinaehominis]SDL96508.1 ornithine cyclodeaminase [Aerococcus urinaehominis]